MFRKKKSNEPKYYKTLGWCWGYLFLYPLGYSMRAVTEYDPNDTYELFCHDCIRSAIRILSVDARPLYIFLRR